MDLAALEKRVENIDERTKRIEQILPTLPTKEELKLLATKEEMHAAIQAAVAPLATRDEVRAEGERTRRHVDVVAESLRADIKAIAEGHAVLAERMDAMKVELKADIAALDGRVMRLEASGRWG